MNVGALRLSNPILAASGTFGYGVEFAHLVNLDRLGGIVVKGPFPRTDRRELLLPGFVRRPPECSTPWVCKISVSGHSSRKNYRPCGPYRTPSPANVFGCTVEEYAGCDSTLEDAEGVAAYELNISCPNTAHGGIQFGSDPRLVAEVVAAARAVAKRPLWVKLSPNVTDIAAIARAAEQCGADALTVANTYQAMSVDIRT